MLNDSFNMGVPFNNLKQHSTQVVNYVSYKAYIFCYLE